MLPQTTYILKNHPILTKLPPRRKYAVAYSNNVLSSKSHYKTTPSEMLKTLFKINFYILPIRAHIHLILDSVSCRSFAKSTNGRMGRASAMATIDSVKACSLIFTLELSL